MTTSKFHINVLAVLLFTATILLFSACDKDDPIIPNEEEFITTLQLILTEKGSAVNDTFSFRDLDGDGGRDPIIISPNLISNTSYTGQVLLLNEIAQPFGNISDEVREEGLDHQFFFQTVSNFLQIVYTDMDSENNPIGLTFDLTTANSGTENLTVTLRHEPNKNGNNVAAGDITNAGGESDIEVTFEVNVQ